MKFLLICLAVLVALLHVTQASWKKGVAAYPGTLLCDDFKILNNMSWWYDWHTEPTLYTKTVTNACPPGTDVYMPQRVPMVKKHNSRSPAIHIPADAKYVLGFNEPDHADQANMTPQQAADAWPLLEQASRGLPLVSPCTAGENFHWFDEFLRLCHNCRIDYIAAHKYSCDANVIMAYMQKLHHKYHKKIWLTEFACPHTDDVHKQLHLMQTLLPQLEKANFIYRYSWFEARRINTAWVQRSASLFYNGSSTLTPVGKFYNEFQGSSHAHIVG